MGNNQSFMLPKQGLRIFFFLLRNTRPLVIPVPFFCAYVLSSSQVHSLVHPTIANGIWSLFWPCPYPSITQLGVTYAKHQHPCCRRSPLKRILDSVHYRPAPGPFRMAQACSAYFYFFHLHPPITFFDCLYCATLPLPFLCHCFFFDPDKGPSFNISIVLENILRAE